MLLEFFDTTLRDGEQAPGNTLDPKQKLKIAKALENLNVDIIEAGFPASSSEDFESCRLIAKSCKKTIVCGFARCKEADVDAVYESLKQAKHSGIHIFLPASDLHINKKLGMNRKEIIELAERTLNNISTKKFEKVYFGIEDATRSEKSFLFEMISTILKFEVDCITIADTVGYAQPSEIYSLVKEIKTLFPKQKFGIHCHNDLGLATANTLAAINAGIDQVQTTINGIGERSGNCPMEEVLAAITARPDYYETKTHIDLKKIKSISDLVYNSVGRIATHEKPVVGINSFRHEAGIHIDGIQKDPNTYEFLNPEIFGQKRQIVKGRHSGHS